MRITKTKRLWWHSLFGVATLVAAPACASTPSDDVTLEQLGTTESSVITFTAPKS